MCRCPAGKRGPGVVTCADAQLAALGDPVQLDVQRERVAPHLAGMAEAGAGVHTGAEAARRAWVLKAPCTSFGRRLNSTHWE